MTKTLFCTKLTGDNMTLRDYILRVIEKYKKLEESEILEIGIGNGRFGFLIGNRFKTYYGIEPDKEYLTIANQSIPYRNIKYDLGSAEKIPYDKKFDILFYSFSWHMLKDYENAIAEAKRVLKNNGIILIIDPIENSQKWADKRLMKDSPEFDQERYNKKMAEIKRGIDNITSQKLFKISLFESGKINLWVLTKI